MPVELPITVAAVFLPVTRQRVSEAWDAAFAAIPPAPAVPDGRHKDDPAWRAWFASLDASRVRAIMEDAAQVWRSGLQPRTPSAWFTAQWPALAYWTDQELRAQVDYWMAAPLSHERHFALDVVLAEYERRKQASA